MTDLRTIIRKSNRYSYGSNISVLGYEKFTNEEGNVKNGIDVLVGEEW